MHEGYIAKNIIEEIKKISKENSINKVFEIVVVCGKLHSVVPEALKFFFDNMKKYEPLLNETELIIEEESIIAKCLDCKNEFLSEFYFFKCPVCNSNKNEIIKGDHIFIKTIRGD